MSREVSWVVLGLMSEFGVRVRLGFRFRADGSTCSIIYGTCTCTCIVNTVKSLILFMVKFKFKCHKFYPSVADELWYSAKHAHTQLCACPTHWVKAITFNESGRDRWLYTL